MTTPLQRDQAMFIWCPECDQRHDADFDCCTYKPVCEDCGHEGDRRFRARTAGGQLYDVLAPSLTPDHIECQCGSVSIRMEVHR